jgi:flagellar biosynthetic protein FliO
MLVLVLVLMVAAVWFLKRLQKRSQPSALDLEVVGRLGLAPKQHLSVVRVGDEHWVLGVTDSSIRFIGEYHGETALPQTRQEARPSFASALDRSVKRLGRTFTRKREAAVEPGR